MEGAAAHKMAAARFRAGGGGAQSEDSAWPIWTSCGAAPPKTETIQAQCGLSCRRRGLLPPAVALPSTTPDVAPRALDTPAAPQKQRKTREFPTTKPSQKNPRADIDLAAPPEQPHRRSQTHGIHTRIPPKKLTCVGSGRNLAAAPPPPLGGWRRLRGGRGRLGARVSVIQQKGWIRERRGDEAARWARWWPVCVCAALRQRLGGAQDTSSRRERKRRRLRADLRGGWVLTGGPRASSRVWKIRVRDGEPETVTWVRGVLRALGHYWASACTWPAAHAAQSS
jgi:hypothetical protein